MAVIRNSATVTSRKPSTSGAAPRQTARASSTSVGGDRAAAKDLERGMPVDHLSSRLEAAAPERRRQQEVRRHPRRGEDRPAASRPARPGARPAPRPPAPRGTSRRPGQGRQERLDDLGRPELGPVVEGRIHRTSRSPPAAKPRERGQSRMGAHPTLTPSSPPPPRDDTRKRKRAGAHPSAGPEDRIVRCELERQTRDELDLARRGHARRPRRSRCCG